MDTLSMLGTFMNIVVIAFGVVMILIAAGLTVAVTLLVKNIRFSGKSTRSRQRRNSSRPNPSAYRTRRNPV